MGGREDLEATRDRPAAERAAPGVTTESVLVKVGGRELGATTEAVLVNVAEAKGAARDLGVTVDAVQGRIGATVGPSRLGPGELAATTDSLPRSTGRVEAPERLGRYLVIEQLGAGGMGVVFKAYDPVLDRKVAIKLLRGQATEHTRTRLLREAQAMAKLSHPAVVPVFDVGTVEGQVFVAMDFIAGETLQAWMTPPKPWREVLEVFEQAGRGLAAAHAAGLIHRDFKPDNVLLSREPDGGLRAQVADFGLARRDDEAGPDAARDVEGSLAWTSLLDRGLTHVGAVVGTPLYMSPEQHRGAAVDPRTDQFSFCVALFEALYGVRPFDGETVEALALAASLPQREAPPAGSEVPGWLHRVCLRGMQPEREARFLGMEELLAEVMRGRTRGRQRWLFAGGAAVIAAAATAVVLARGEPPQLCAGGPERMIGVWDEAVKRRGEQAFTATGKVFAGDAWRRARTEVEGYSAAWLAMYRDSCEATMVRSEQSAELMDLRALCLAERLEELRALTGLYGAADGTVVKQAVAAAQALPSLDVCADVVALREVEVKPPAEQAEAVAATRSRLAEARTLRVAGKAKESLAVATSALGEAEALGFAPLVARARLNVGMSQAQAGEHEAAVPTLTTAVTEKLGVREDEGALDGMLELAEVLGFHLVRDKEAAPWVAMAEGMITRIGEPPVEVARMLLIRAEVAIAGQRYAEAEALLQRSTALVAERLGAEDPRMAKHRNALGGVYVRTGKYAEAQVQFEQAVALEVATHGPNHPVVAYPLNNLALSYERQGRFVDAVATLRRAAELFERTSGADHPNVGILRQNIGGMLRSAGELAEARVEIDAGVKILEAKLGREHPAVGRAWTLSGDIARDSGELSRARADYQRADDMRRTVLGEEHPDRSLSLLGLGRVALAEGKSAEAVVALEKALALMGTTQPDPVDQAEARFYLARALPEGQRARARSLATQARADFAGAGIVGQRAVPEVEQWLAAHP